MSLPFPTHAEAVRSVERQFLSWFPFRLTGQIDAASPASISYPATTPITPTPMFAHLAEGFAAPNNGKLFKVASMSTTSTTIINPGSVTTALGDGDELLLLWPCPAYFITTDDGGKWVVGQYETGKPYIELEIIGGASEPYENTGGACNYRHDMVLDVRLFTPENQQPSFALQDRADAAFREWQHPEYTMIFEGRNTFSRRKNTTESARPGFRASISSFRYWYITDGTPR